MMPMQVLHICSYYASPLYRLLFDAISRRGVEQKVFYFAVQGTEYRAKESGVYFSNCYSNFDRLFFSRKEKKAADALYQQIDVASFDVLHAHSLFTNGFLALQAKRRFEVPYIVAVRNTDVNSFFKVRPWLRQTGIEIMREAEAVIFLSSAYKDKVLRHFVPKNLRASVEQKCYVIPNGVNEVFFDSAPLAPCAPDEVIRVIQVGDINRNKNQLAVARACRMIEESGRQLSYTVVGRIRDKRVVSKLMKYDFVEIKQPLPQRDLIEVYRSADVFVMPSIHETFGLVYVEAMSQGIPVVYTKGQGFDGWLDNPKFGQGVDARDVEGIRDAIMRLKREKGATQFTGLLKASRRFRWSDISLLYHERYAEAITHAF